MRRRLICAFLVSTFVALGSSQVSADLIANFDENGHLSADNGFTTTGVNGVDPFDPTNGLTPLIYVIGSGGQSIVDGDVFLNEPGATSFSDLLRFYFDPNTGNELIIVYSDKDGADGALADVGLPNTFQNNTLTLTETTRPDGSNGLFGYVPTGDQPGSPLVAQVGKVTYNFTSDTAAVPEPTSVVLLGGGALVLLAGRKLFRRSA